MPQVMCPGQVLFGLNDTNWQTSTMSGILNRSSSKVFVPHRILSTGLIFRLYHSFDHLNNDDIIKSKQGELKEKILSITLNETVKKHGFTQLSLDSAIEKFQSNHKQNFANQNWNVLFDHSNPNQEIISWYLTQARLPLAEYSKTEQFQALGSQSDRMRFLIEKRLRFNADHLTTDSNSSLHANLKGLLSNLILPTNISSSITQLYELADDVLFYSGDVSHSFDWYEKRLKVAAIFVKCELFMLSDQSKGFNKTYKFLQDQIRIYDFVNTAKANTQEWLIFNGFSLINLIRSQLARG